MKHQNQLLNELDTLDSYTKKQDHLNLASNKDIHSALLEHLDANAYLLFTTLRQRVLDNNRNSLNILFGDGLND